MSIVTTLTTSFIKQLTDAGVSEDFAKAGLMAGKSKDKILKEWEAQKTAATTPKSSTSNTPATTNTATEGSNPNFVMPTWGFLP